MAASSTTGSTTPTGTTSLVVDGPAGPIEVRDTGDGHSGDGHPVVLLPSLGRGAVDFEDLAASLAAAGHRAIRPEPRGIGGSTGELSGLTMADLALDVAAVIHALAGDPRSWGGGTGGVILVGHAFGNRVARMVATDFPHLVESVVLLAAGGLVPAAPEHAAALRRVFDVELSDEDHLDAVAQAFFASGNDASVWFDGWHATVAAAQAEATSAQSIQHWWGAGGKEVLVVQPADDVMAVPENSERLVELDPDRIHLRTITSAGHALLPEQPAAVADAVLGWVQERITERVTGSREGRPARDQGKRL